jgi:predicted acetyltransferase
LAAGRLPPAPSRVVSGRSGDHPLVHQFLLAVFQGPSRDEFQASQDDPFYEPTDRLLVKRGQKVLSHVHLTKRTMWFGRLRLPIAAINWLGTLPEFRGQGMASELVRAAEAQMIEDGAVLGTVRTKIPHFFRRFGWAVCGRHSHSRAMPREILARLSALRQGRRDTPLNLRVWRHVELPALMRIYAQNTAETHGPLDRSEAYWRWLISRRGFDHIIVALDGPDRLELDEATAPIVGYAVVKGRHVVELCCAPTHPDAAQQLLARACSDIIEEGDHPLVLHAPPVDPLHRVVLEAGGTLHHQEMDEQGNVFMVKLLDVAKFLRSLRDELHARLRRARFSRSSELGLLVDDERHQLTAARRGMKTTTGKVGRSHLAMNHCELTRLVLGHMNLDQAVEQGRVEAATHVAVETAAVLFPQLPLWRPMLDDLPA